MIRVRVPDQLPVGTGNSPDSCTIGKSDPNAAVASFGQLIHTVLLVKRQLEMLRSLGEK